VFYRVSIAQKLLKSDFWTKGDRIIALLLAGYISFAYITKFIYRELAHLSLVKTYLICKKFSAS